MKKILILLLFICLSCQSSGQFYPMEAGAVGGYSSGFNFRVYLEEELSYSAWLSFRGSGIQAHLLREKHMELDYWPGGALFLVHGLGPHVGVYYTDHFNLIFDEIYFQQKIFAPVIGFNAYAALEYRLTEWPLSIGLGYKPYMEVSLQQIFAFNPLDFAFTVKYRFDPNH